MKVLVVGSNGQIGRQVIDLLLSSGEHQARAMVRTAEQAERFRALGAETVVADLEGEVEAITEAARGCDAIVFTAGSGGHTPADKTLLVDLDGAVKTMEAAEQAGVDRFIMVSAIQAHNRSRWAESIKPYYAAKHYADRMLEATKLNYTIVRPGGLLNEPGTGRVAAAENLARGSIPRADVAAFILAVLQAPNTYRRSFDLTSGGVEIAKSVQQL
ncbi:SDR family oxidoreductase [Paenibacillus xerothermodurans]|uniref:SDR family NAD(P)-dependent oxidoreductase n=1 Tax=Paenibacillus xerothermodurans TaxID=1977292 RepID=A0A2W1NRI9_PAEXE|nr:SDR family oxidoreductase [Paenibacillus xerothermodurans]PZE22145.1 SDR family NAD(P)-dependent oxidoreductase [Paenibacillus xerothermodurans]